MIFLLLFARFKLALQQNEIMDVFYDDWTNLGDDDSNFGSKADNHLKVEKTKECSEIRLLQWMLAIDYDRRKMQRKLY